MDLINRLIKVRETLSIQYRVRVKTKSILFSLIRTTPLSSLLDNMKMRTSFKKEQEAVDGDDESIKMEQLKRSNTIKE